MLLRELNLAKLFRQDFRRLALNVDPLPLPSASSFATRLRLTDIIHFGVLVLTAGAAAAPPVSPTEPVDVGSGAHLLLLLLLLLLCKIVCLFQ